ncbi:heme biosynthesis protein HemY [Pasteurellaceae bacterium LIM206]|nr:heme biosynthesis protein HemY [Pasteurellaceae bacterium LIM206]
MFRVLFLMIVLLAGLVAGPYLSGKQGYVLIETGSYNIEMSITTLIILFVIAMALVYGLEWLITRFCRLSRSSYTFFSRRKRSKAQKQTLEGLMRMTEGDYSKAEKLIGKNAKHSEEPILNFIKAAEAAQQRGDEFSANRYLIEATELAGTDNLLVELARTRILLQQNKLPAARSAVDSLLVLAPDNVEALKLAAEIYLRSKAYAALDDILEAIENSGIYSPRELLQLRHQTEDGLLNEIMNEEGSDGLLEWWEKQPRKRRNDNYVKVGLMGRLIDCNDHESAYEIGLDLLKKIEKNDEISTALYTQLTRLQPTDTNKLVKLLEKRSSSATDDERCYINRALGYLYVRDGDFAKASEAFKKLSGCTKALEPNDATMAVYVFEQVKDFDAAKQVREQRLATVMSATNLTQEGHKTATSNALPPTTSNETEGFSKKAIWVEK